MKKTAKVDRGFTLIELLIVIALLGALAIGLIATIDPFEQLKKGRDTATRNAVTEFYNANLRYYGTKGNFPWGSGVTFVAPENLAGGSNVSAGLTELIRAGELKANFTAAAGVTRLANIYVAAPAIDTLSVCFTPESKNFQLDSNTIYDLTGSTAAQAGCSANVTAGGNMCAWCIE
jgi:prepilin-type N-terminal cleavage/methylation domain-containing protein